MKFSSIITIVTLMLVGCTSQTSTETTGKEKSETPEAAAAHVDLPYSMR